MESSWFKKGCLDKKGAKKLLDVARKSCAQTSEAAKTAESSQDKAQPSDIGNATFKRGFLAKRPVNPLDLSMGI